MNWLARLLWWVLMAMLQALADALRERDGLRAQLAQVLQERDAALAKAREHGSAADALGELPGSFVEHAGSLREGSETGDIAVAWTASGIITVVTADRTAGDVTALVHYGLARCKAGES